MWWFMVHLQEMEKPWLYLVIVPPGVSVSRLGRRHCWPNKYPTPGFTSISESFSVVICKCLRSMEFKYAQQSNSNLFEDSKMNRKCYIKKFNK